jgi:hypothetical protein
MKSGGTKMQRAFVIRPFGKKTDASGTAIDFEQVHEHLIAPALRDAGLGGGTTGEIIDAGNVREDMFSLIIEADLVVCDITVHNANVFYELGIRHALRKRRTVLIKGGPVSDTTPFDVLTDRYVPYNIGDAAASRTALVSAIKATLISDRETDSPVFKMLPALHEIDPATVKAIPTDFTEELGRARAAKSAGWLRLLASELDGQRFQWPALRLVGKAQWDLTDYEGAQKTWERIRDNDPDDIAANLALGSVYERLYRKTKNAELLEASNQAIVRVRNSGKASADQRVEALTLEGRNEKTLWRLEWDKLDNVAERRSAATNRLVRKAYEAYRKAYFFDLNHYWSGLAALQQGTITLDLSNEETWQDTFDNVDQALAYRAELKRQLEALHPIVSQAIDASLARMSSNDQNRVWAEISAADHLFLIEERPSRVIEAYKAAVPKNGFAWNAARGQLELFARLGYKAELANKIILTIDALVLRPEVSDLGELHMVIFSGHRVDESGRAALRFPLDREAQARDLIREALSKAKTGWKRIEVLASAAPGSDILCHEVCAELGIDSVVCLSMPKDVYARFVFENTDYWRSRYLELIGRRPLLQLSNEKGLPRWLEGSGIDPWERSNSWVLEMARTRGAKKITLIALWDGKAAGDAPGGTAQMVQIARQAGNVDIVRIDAGQLLS